MSDYQAEPTQTYAISPEEQTAALLPWRYGEMAWEPLDAQRTPWIVKLLVGLLVLGVIFVVSMGLWFFAPHPVEGIVASVSVGDLLVQDGEGGPWMTAEAGRVIRPGARLRAEPNTLSALSFGDGSTMRIESGGEWVVTRMAASRNSRVKRVKIRHLSGQASYASAPLQQGVSSEMIVEIYDVQMVLSGVASVLLGDLDQGVLSIWQGACRVSGFGQRWFVGAGDRVQTNSSQRLIDLDAQGLIR